MNASVSAPPSTPAPISVASTPNASAAGPTIANDNGTPAIEIIQSRLATRPRRCDGTSRCRSVYQITIRIVIDVSATSATSMACHTLVAIPNPAVATIPTVHATYRTVTARRGVPPRCPQTIAPGAGPPPPPPQ